MTVEPYDHVRASPDGAIPAGVYRVVGTGGERVTLLRVADSRDRRVHSGAIERVDSETLAALDPAENPDAGLSLSALFDPLTAYGTALRHWLGV